MSGFAGFRGMTSHSLPSSGWRTIHSTSPPTTHRRLTSSTSPSTPHTSTPGSFASSPTNRQLSRPSSRPISPAPLRSAPARGDSVRLLLPAWPADNSRPGLQSQTARDSPRPAPQLDPACSSLRAGSASGPHRGPPRLTPPPATSRTGSATSPSTTAKRNLGPHHMFEQSRLERALRTLGCGLLRAARTHDPREGGALALARSLALSAAFGGPQRFAFRPSGVVSGGGTAPFGRSPSACLPSLRAARARLPALGLRPPGLALGAPRLPPLRRPRARELQSSGRLVLCARTQAQLASGVPLAVAVACRLSPFCASGTRQDAPRCARGFRTSYRVRTLRDRP